MDNIINQAIKEYGEKHQLIIAIQELAELIKEITDDIRGIGTRDNIITEIVDVQIVIQELIIIYDISDAELYAESQYKLKRLKGYMDIKKEKGAGDEKSNVLSY